MYIFISYAREDSQVADQVEAFLVENGFRVFHDKQIPSAANWNRETEKALRECDRMVLLLSPHSMPERKEVEREWFYFDQKGKPIHPLYLEDCELDSRFISRNYIDARQGLADALNKLLEDLGREVESPAPMPANMQAMLDEIQSGHLPSVNLAADVKNHKPANLTEYRLTRIAAWSMPEYRLDRRFVNLTLSLDRGEGAQERWAEDFRTDDLREVLEKTKDKFPALVLLGRPGSGKSTLLRRLQLDHSVERLRDNADEISFFIQLNGYHAAADGKLLEPREWLEKRWKDLYPDLPRLDSFMKNGRALLLLDALNEMPHKSPEEYDERIVLWREFAQDAARHGNRVVFSCRSLDYSVSLGSPDLRVPHVTVQPMNPEQVRTFLDHYLPGHAEHVWAQLTTDPRQFELYQTPYFLKLLCGVAEGSGKIPHGRAGLFTSFVRQALDREKEDLWFKSGPLLNQTDRQKVLLRKWRDDFDLPDIGLLIPQLCEMAWKMQKKGEGAQETQIRIGYREALEYLDGRYAEEILDAGVSLNVLDKDLTQEFEIAFFHQLLQEYFAARRLAREPDPALVHVEWAADRVRPSLPEAIAGLDSWDPLPPLAQTGWEETTLTAIPMARDQESFICGLMTHNLPLAARCAATAELKIGEGLKGEIREALIRRTQDMSVDLRARIVAGEALGLIEDPRFERRNGHLMPPLVEIKGGTYPMGLEKGRWEDEQPAHTATLSAFQIGKFPVTNAEYKLFIISGGYKEERWWDTAAALEWLREQTSLQPLYWDDSRFHNPAQPVVGVTWYEARAYCNWLTANAGGNGKMVFHLPTEAEFEAAARGKEGRLYPYGNKFDAARCNTMEGHVRRTTPVGIYDNATPEGAFDLSGNVLTWTQSIYKPYPYRSDDGRENLEETGARRVLRGGSWGISHDFARAVVRAYGDPHDRVDHLGFRVVCCVRPPSL